MNHDPVYLQQLGMVCALGDTPRQISQRLFGGGPECLTVTDALTPERSLPLGQVDSPLPSVAHLPVHQQTRNNQLLLAAWQQIADQVQPRIAELDPLRVGIVLGASTSGIREGEAAVARLEQTGEFPPGFTYRQQEMSAPALTLADWLGVSGPAFTISTACSSSGKALASARRLLREGWCDLVIAGGVDALCRLTVNGFSALESVSDRPCVPFSDNRRGINIGEGAALFAVGRDAGPVALRGVGETSDAHHISAPAPDGRGAMAAMEGALADAAIEAAAVDYLNLHGTATAQNDKMESTAVHDIFGERMPCSSTKGYTGHTLGAAGAIEAGVCWLTLTQQSAPDQWQLPVHRWDGVPDPALAPLNLVTEPCHGSQPHYVMSNSFAFGGNNIALLMEKKP